MFVRGYLEEILELHLHTRNSNMPQHLYSSTYRDRTPKFVSVLRQLLPSLYPQPGSDTQESLKQDEVLLSRGAYPRDR